MSSDRDELAVSPAEALRAQVVDTLSRHFAEDNLTVEQLEERIDRVYAARTAADLRAVLSDLPAIAEPAPAAPAATTSGKPAPVAAERKTLLALLGGFARRGAWVVPQRIQAIAIMGGIELDLREAQLPPEGVEIRVFALMGGVSVKVPDNVRLESDGIAIMGGFEDQTREPSASSAAAAPLVRVTGFAMMGGVDAKVSPRR